MLLLLFLFLLGFVEEKQTKTINQNRELVFVTVGRACYFGEHKIEFCRREISL